LKTQDYEVVCVDDDLDVLEITELNVQALGYKSVGFPNVEDAFLYIEKNQKKIVLILSDLRMDNQNGFDLKKKLRDVADDIPFTIITGYWTSEMSQDAMGLGVNSFIQKPATENVIGEQVNKFVPDRISQLDDDREMIEGFLEESSPMLDEIEQLILELEENPNSDQTLSTYFRLLHTVKGTASCVGLIQLGKYTHQYEDFIGELRNKSIPVTTKSINILLQGLDDLKYLFSETVKTLSDDFFDLDELTAKYSFTQDFGVVAEVSSEEEAGTQQVSERVGEDDKVTVSMNILNDFMEESGELTVIRNSILKTVKKIESKYRGDKDVEILNELLDGMYNVTSNIQGKIIDMRQVPLKNTFRPFKRLIRDLSKKLGKEVEFTIVGEELNVDNTIAKLYSNTLIHILRNSLDHGLETIEKRSAVGKATTGELSIIIKEVGEDIVMEIKDDGNGIDPEIIKKKAVEKGLYSDQEVSTMSTIEIVNIIFDSGFSTAEQVSDLSGRGVGMDMVRSSFEEMGGNVMVKSEKGLGSTFKLSIPIPKSVLIINALLVNSSNQHFIFHMDEVAEVIRHEFDSANSKLFTYDNKKMIEHNGEMIQLISLGAILCLESHDETPVSNIVVLRINGRKFGVLVDEIHEFEEVVSRNISETISSHKLYHGASLLGTGEVAMIISAEGIANSCGIDITLEKSKTLIDDDIVEVIEPLNEFMSFKYNNNDSLCIPIDQVERLTKIKTQSIEVVGSKLYVKYLDKVLPIIDPAQVIGLESGFDLRDLTDRNSLVDLEVIVTHYNGLKYGILVYELNEIQSTSESINTDTVDTDGGLVGSVFLEGRTVCILDLRYITLNYKKDFAVVDVKSIDNDDDSLAIAA
jgi:two-component system chemotaxis sensor kinase CheA